MLPRLKVLFLCTGNSCRSQMAEGWTRHLHGESIQPHSAGTRPGKLDPLAVEVMAEAGVDISAQRAKSVDALEERFDFVITVCDHARQSCPLYPGETTVLYAGFPDPPHLARDAETRGEALAHYRRVRDLIRDYVETLPGSLTFTHAPGEPRNS